MNIVFFKVILFVLEILFFFNIYFHCSQTKSCFNGEIKYYPTIISNPVLLVSEIRVNILMVLVHRKPRELSKVPIKGVTRTDGQRTENSVFVRPFGGKGRPKFLSVSVCIKRTGKILVRVRLH